MDCPLYFKQECKICIVIIHEYIGFREVCDLSCLVSDLQLQNKRLSEENVKLRKQLGSNEEMSSNMVHELEDLRDAVKK